LLEVFFREEYRWMQREAQILRDKLELPCNDTEREAIRTVYKLFQADLAEVSASIRYSEIRETEERAAVREMEERAAVREMEERAAVREMEERAAVREMEESAAVCEMEERAAVREMEERAAVRENRRENQQHEWLLNLSKEINQISDAKRAVLENLTATSSEAERQRLESLYADLQTRENVAAQDEAYLKQGMATSL
jgi:predicted ATP-dependent Lon-type protease